MILVFDKHAGQEADRHQRIGDAVDPKGNSLAPGWGAGPDIIVDGDGHTQGHKQGRAGDDCVSGIALAPAAPATNTR